MSTLDILCRICSVLLVLVMVTTWYRDRQQLRLIRGVVQLLRAKAVASEDAGRHPAQFDRREIFVWTAHALREAARIVSRELGDGQ